MVYVYNLSGERLPTTMGDGSVIVLEVGETKEMDEVYANKFIEIYGKDKISFVEQPKEKIVAEKVVIKKIKKGRK